MAGSLAGAFGAVPMMDIVGRSPLDNAGALSQFAERDRCAPLPRHTNHARDAQWAVTVLRKSSRSLLATMDAVTKLFECTHQSEDCSRGGW